MAGLRSRDVARSGHASVRSLERYARPGMNAVVRHVAEATPPAAGPLSLSYTQRPHAVQDIEALAALHRAEEYLSAEVARARGLYTYMGVYPGTGLGAQLLLETSAQIAMRGGAARLIVKTAAQGHRMPTVAENVAALERVARVRRQAPGDACPLPWARQVDYESIYAEASALIEAVLALDADLGAALRTAFSRGLLDVPFRNAVYGRIFLQLAEMARMCC